MKLVLRVFNDTTLQLSLDDLLSPVVRQLSIGEGERKLLQQCAENYQAVINQPHNMDVLQTIGYQLFALLNQHAALMKQWLNIVGMRQLEIHTTLEPNPLQNLLLNLPWEIMALRHSVWNLPWKIRSCRARIGAI